MDILATKYHKTFQLHLNNVATQLAKLKVAVLDKQKWTM